MNELYTCDGCERHDLAIGDDCTTNRVGACLCFDCLRMMDENERALWDDAFDFRSRVAEVLHG